MARNNWVAIIGAGPAGLFAARELASQGVQVVLVNRDILPGGLAEYGIYPDKHVMKEGLRAQFQKILALENVHYFGNVTVGIEGDIRLDTLLPMGFQAVLVTVGAQGTKWLGLPGEEQEGVFHAKDLVYHYNHLPPFSQQDFKIGKRVGVIGAGNVSLDITHYLTSLPQVEQVVAIIRRGPAEIKFDRKELEYVAQAVDRVDLESEIQRVTPVMLSVNQDPDATRAFFQQAISRGGEIHSRARLLFRFLESPTRILGDASRRMCGLEVEDNTLVLSGSDVKAVPLGSHQVLDLDTIIFAIGDRVDKLLGLPVVHNEFVKNPKPRFPVEGLSYEVFDPQAGTPMVGYFVAGWAREASTGLVGIARRDGMKASQAVVQYLQTLPENPNKPLAAFNLAARQSGKFIITQAELACLQIAAQEQAQKSGLVEFKFDSNEQMLNAIGQHSLTS